MRAPEFPQNLRWFNLPAEALAKEGSPRGLHMKELRDHKVVLIDFWTYSCVNCIRTFPHLKSWQEKYSSIGLVIVGVHTPEFEFEKDVSNVRAAIKRFGISYPVVMDSDYQIWSLYDNSYWPRKFLINKDGQIVYDHSGEGGYLETELAIRAALLDLNPHTKRALGTLANKNNKDARSGAGVNPKLKLPKTDGTLPSTSFDNAQDKSLGADAVCLPTTSETYLGSMRGRPGKTWQVKGEWKAHSEFIEHESKTENFVDCLVLNFEAAEVNLVMEAKTERPAKIHLELSSSTSPGDGWSPLAAGGKFFNDLEVQESKMYNLLSGEKQIKGDLKIFTKDRGVRMYAFTFGGACNPK